MWQHKWKKEFNGNSYPYLINQTFKEEKELFAVRINFSRYKQ